MEILKGLIMKPYLRGLTIALAGLTPNLGSAAISGWLSAGEQLTNSQHSERQNKQNENIFDSTIQHETTPALSAESPRIQIHETKDLPKSNTDEIASKHLDATNSFLSNTTITSLGTEDYMAVVMLNSSLVQAGLEIKLNSVNKTTQNLFNSAVGCINSKKSESLAQISKKLIAEHQRLVDLRNFVGSGASIGGSYTAKCI